MLLLTYLPLFLCVLAVKAAAPVFSPTIYSAIVGLNTTIGATLATVAYTFSDPNEVITLSMDPAIDGYSYFGFSGNNIILATGLDVEFGGTTWTARILATDNGTTPETGTATLSLTTYESTTTTTTTPAPPGYSWFDQQENVILFGSFFGFIALLTGVCVLLCFRFHRIGTCLPRSCPEYRQCRASARRQCAWCPLPCVFHDHVRIEKEDSSVYDDRESTSSLSKRGVMSEPLPPSLSTVASAKKSKSDASRQNAGPSPIRSVTPVVMGNVDLRDVGFDGMMSPGFNAPMFTSYGGSSGASATSKKKKRRKF